MTLSNMERGEADLEDLLNTVRIFTDDIKMKCVNFVIERGKKVEGNGIQMPGGIAIGS